MLPTNKFQNIHVNETYLGYANGSYVYYRHFIIMPQLNYTITVKSLIGNPALLVKIANNDVFPVSYDVNTWDIKSDVVEKAQSLLVWTLQ